MTSVSSIVAAALIMNLLYRDETCSWSWTGMKQNWTFLCKIKYYVALKGDIVTHIFINIIETRDAQISWARLSGLFSHFHPMRWNTSQLLSEIICWLFHDII